MTAALTKSLELPVGADVEVWPPSISGLDGSRPIEQAKGHSTSQDSRTGNKAARSIFNGVREEGDPSSNAREEMGKPIAASQSQG